ncbi:MAG: hypothetical protein E6772_15180 [Dysgonomonas sp.]|nr:hypothetical protein [Dysgonomonas sp.]
MVLEDAEINSMTLLIILLAKLKKTLIMKKFYLLFTFLGIILYSHAQYATLDFNRFRDTQVIMPNKSLIIGNENVSSANLRISYFGDNNVGDGYIKYPRNFYFMNNNEKVLIGIFQNGNVSIGQADPTEKLSVNGTIRAKEIKVEPSGWAAWPDYVFHSDYNLRSLKEVKSYIKENNHLPDIPSEAEVKEDGVGLGELTTKLLQKIEELTLYVIQQEEKIEELNNKLSDLENSNR